MTQGTQSEPRPSRNGGAVILPRQSGVPLVLGVRRDPVTGKILPPVTPGVVRV